MTIAEVLSSMSNERAAFFISEYLPLDIRADLHEALVSFERLSQRTPFNAEVSRNMEMGYSRQDARNLASESLRDADGFLN